jgi:hypothetical protein
MTNKILTLASEVKDLRSKWLTLSIYERFEQTVVAVLTLVIAVIIALAGWQLLLSTLRFARCHVFNPADPLIFQGLFGMLLTVLLALEFQAHIAGCQAPSPRHRPGTSCSVDRATRTGSQIHHSRSLSNRPGSDRCPGRRRFGPRNCILACRQLRTSGRRWGARVTFATSARDGVHAGSCVICSHELRHQRRERS